MNSKALKLVVTVVSVLLIVCLSAVTKVMGASVVYFNGTTRKLPIYSVEREDKKISISFDCAYGDEFTIGLLDVLDEYKAKCTFFATEFWVKNFPDKAKEIVKRGHDLGTHSKTHPKMSKLSKGEIQEELNSSIALIEQTTNQKVTLFRPPFGDYDDLLIETATEMGLYTIQWDVDSIDWKDLSAKEITSRIDKKTKSGSIILCHNNGLHTLEALPFVISNLQQKGYEFVRISDLIYKQNYKIDNFGVQKPNNKEN